MFKTNQQAMINNQNTQKKTRNWFNRKFVCKTVTEFTIGDLVLFNIKNRISNLKAGQIHWIGPCKVEYEHPGKLFDLNYEVNGKNQTYYRVHPEFMKIYRGQTT